MTRGRRSGHRLVALVGSLAAISSTAVAQQQHTSSDPALVQIRRVLRAFYFSLAHRDWEALTARILPAKVVAHHPAPPAIVAASVARCNVGDIGIGAVGSDEFRFIEFDGRWWIVHLELSNDPAAVQVAR